MSTETLSKTENSTSSATVYFAPHADFQNHADGTTVRLELPGVPSDGVEVTVEERVLTIVGRRKTFGSEGEFLHREIQPNDYRRAFKLATRLNPDAIRAEMRDGVLQLEIPISETVKPRRIAVS